MRGHAFLPISLPTSLCSSPIYRYYGRLQLNDRISMEHRMGRLMRKICEFSNPRNRTLIRIQMIMFANLKGFFQPVVA